MFRFTEIHQTLQELLEIPGLWNQLYAALALSLSGFLAGTVEGWPGAINLELSGIGRLKQERIGKTNALLEPADISVIFVIMILSATLHMMITGALLDRYGRRMGCWFLNFLAPSGWAFLITAQSQRQLYIGAAMIGTIGFSGENVGVTFLSEVTNERLRGPLISMFMFFHCFGQLASHVLMVEIDFQTFHTFCLAVSLVCPFVFWRLPESPAYLMKKLRVEDARESVAWYHGSEPEVLEVEMQKLKDTTPNNINDCKSIFGNESNRRATVIVVSLLILTELTGTSVVEVFAGTSILMIEPPSGRTMSAKTASLTLAVCRFIGGLLNVYFVERSGRKPTLTLSLWFMALFMGTIFVFLICAQFHPSNANPPNQAASVHITAKFYILFLCFALYTFANQMFLVTTEVFSGELLTTDTKGAIMALAGFMRILTLVICVLSYNFTLKFDFLGTWSYLGYSLFSGLGAILAYRIIPETQGKTLNEIRFELQKTGQPCRSPPDHLA